MNETNITEVSDPRELTIDEPPVQVVQDIKVVKGQPTDAELAALVAVLSAAAGGRIEPRASRSSICGATPSTSCDIETFSWQRVTLLERMYMRR